METDCQGHMPDILCLLKSLLDWDGRANGLIFGKKTTKVGLHNMWFQGAENKRNPPQVYLMLPCSLTPVVIMLAYH